MKYLYRGVSVYFLMTWLAVVPSLLQAQVALTPVITPALFQPDDVITVTYDVTGTSMAGLTNAYIWVWIPGSNIDARHNINPASSNSSQSLPAKFTKSTDGGNTFFSLTFTPADFFEEDISSAAQLGMLLKGNDWANGQTSDFITDIWSGGFELKLLTPIEKPLFVETGEQITISAETPVASTYKLYINDALTDEQATTSNYSYVHTVAETEGFGLVRLEVSDGVNEDEETFQYIISVVSPEVSRPAGIVPGINYDPSDATKVTLCLWAPNKSSAYVLGDFSEWNVFPEYRMNRDGEFMWIELNDMISGEEYGYQYLVDEKLFLADPYADKILDPDDQYIPSTSYPGLKPYPQPALHNDWYFNRVAVFQTGQSPYAWQVTDFQKPVKEELVIYELLIRDFFDSNNRTYQNLIDTVSYLKRLGINAVELMPIMEFNGNESWGYNPTFLFAADKYYGPKEKLKEFIDKCHAEGIAVILDIAMNHQDMPNPYVIMDFNFDTGKPSPDNKWFNVDARHPFNVFFDMNHESTYTQSYLDTVNYYWINEYHIDGYRFDLSKGFTQTNNPSNVEAWSSYDGSRIALLKRMADKIWSYSPESYIILEHFAANTEEKELAEYRLDEGKGMMLWGNLNHAYNQNTMGFVDESDFSAIYHLSRGWESPHLVGYMESHDEERLMYKNLEYGNASGSYNVKNLATGLNRMKTASTLFYTIPGPKMIWQFGELGYDQSINRCEDGSVNSNCRVSPKPVLWNYWNENDRSSLHKHVSDLLRLRNTYDVFRTGIADFHTSSTLVKQVTLKNNPYTATPVSEEEMNVVMVGNFDVTSRTAAINFPHTGTWYEYYTKDFSMEVNDISVNQTLSPGEYKMYTDFPLDNPLITSLYPEVKRAIHAFPNPADDYIAFQVENEPIQNISFFTIQGKRLSAERITANDWNVDSFSAGLYLAEVTTLHRKYRIKIIKK